MKKLTNLDICRFTDLVLSETMVQYLALMVMEKQDGADQMHKFLKHELDRL